MSQDGFDDLPVDPAVDLAVDLPIDLPIDEDDASLWLRRGGRPRAVVLFVIAIGGVIGATARYALGEVVPIPDNGFPLATLLANVGGSFLLGFVAVVSVDRLASVTYFRPFFAVGLIGSFTTFSTFAVENVLLVDRGDVLVAVVYVPTMLLGGLVAARFGIEAARRIRPPGLRVDA